MGARLIVNTGLTRQSLAPLEGGGCHNTVFLGSRGICFRSVKIFDSLFILHIYAEEIIQNADKDEGAKMFSEALFTVTEKKKSYNVKV